MMETKVGGVIFDYSEWQQSCSHHGGPRGYGHWIFSTDRNIEWATDKETTTVEGVRISPTGYMTVPGAHFSEAKKKAAAVAKRFGWDRLFIQP
jgi:hypothetical protein